MKYVMITVMLIALFGCSKSATNEAQTQLTEDLYFRIYEELAMTTIKFVGENNLEDKIREVYAVHGITPEQFAEFGDKIAEENWEGFLKKTSEIEKKIMAVLMPDGDASRSGETQKTAPQAQKNR